MNPRWRQPTKDMQVIAILSGLAGHLDNLLDAVIDLDCCILRIEPIVNELCELVAYNGPWNNSIADGCQQTGEQQTMKIEIVPAKDTNGESFAVLVVDGEFAGDYETQSAAIEAAIQTAEANDVEQITIHLKPQ